MKSQLAINQRYIYLLILLVAGTALAWATKNLFFFDEDIFVTGSNSDFIQKVWQRTFIGKLSYKLDYLLWGKNPLGYHLTNLFFHLANSVLALLLLKELIKLVDSHIDQFQGKIIPYIFFLLFLITPVHSEPVCYILGRGCLVVTFFSLLAVLLFLKSGFKNNFLLFFSLLCFLLALFSYEISWIVPFIMLSILLFSLYFNKHPFKKHVVVIIPYFILFAVWFIVKVAVIDKMEISDYKDDNLFRVGLVTLIKNSTVLFLRNYIPPFKNAVIFLSVTLAFVLTAFWALYFLYKKHRQIFYFSLLLIIITCLGFSATVFFGVDSHDSESERYIYFSSAFALMLLSVLITVLIKNKIALAAVVVSLCLFYGCTFFKTINGYEAAGVFSENYLQQINQRVSRNDTVFFVNMPSQYNGALLYRAKSRMAGNTSDRVSVMQEYLSYLYNKSNVCITLSVKELDKVPERLLVFENAVDSISAYFSEIKFDKQNFKISAEINNSFSFGKNNTIVVALKDSALYFFK